MLESVAHSLGDLRYEILRLVTDFTRAALKIAPRLFARSRCEQKSQSPANRKTQQKRPDARLLLLDDYIRLSSSNRNPTFLLLLGLSFFGLALCRRASCARLAAAFGA